MCIRDSYTDGSTRRQYLFVLRSVNDYGTDTLQQIANSGFFEALSAWLESQTESGVLPMLGEKRCAEKIEAQTTGYLQGAGPDIGKYQIQCRLVYQQNCLLYTSRCVEETGTMAGSFLCSGYPRPACAGLNHIFRERW